MTDEMKAMPNVKANLERIEGLLCESKGYLLYIAIGAILSGTSLAAIAVKVYV